MHFVLKLITRYYWVVLVVIINVLLYFLQKEKDLVEDFRSMSDVQQMEITRWKDEAGKNRARADIAEIKAENAKHVLDDELKALLKKEVGNLKKNLISYSSVKASTQGEIRGSLRDTLVVVNDQTQRLQAKTFSLKTDHLDFQAMVLPELDSIVANYKIYHNFDITYYYKRPGKPPFNLFRRKKAVAEIKFDNPESQADSIYTVVLERREGFLKRLLGVK